MLFWPAIGKSTSTTRWLASLLGHHRVQQLPHRRVDLGHKRQPLQDRLKQAERLPADHQRSDPPTT